MKNFVNIKILIALLLSAVVFWFGYLFMKDYFEEKMPVFSPRNNRADKDEKTEKKEEIPKKISKKEKKSSPKKAPKPPEKKAPKKVDFILISPNPIGIRFGYQITIQVFGFGFKDTRKKPPSDTDPLLPENKKNLQKKYISLGPVPVRWENLSLNHLRPKNSCAFKVAPQKDPSKATVIPLCKYGSLNPGIVATLRENSQIKTRGKVFISVYWKGPKHFLQKPMKKQEIKIGKNSFFELWGEQNGKIYGSVFMKEGSLKLSGSTRTVWDKKFLIQAFNLQNHETFLQEIENTLWQKTLPFVVYRFHLAVGRYETLENGGKINLRIEQYELTRYLKEQEAMPTQQSPSEKRLRTEFDRALKENDASFLMKIVKSKHSYAYELFRLARRHKNTRNLLAFQLRDFANHYPKPKQREIFYAELLYTLARMGVATPEEEKLVMQYWRGHPPDWETRHTWWRD